MINEQYDLYLSDFQTGVGFTDNDEIVGSLFMDNHRYDLIAYTRAPEIENLDPDGNCPWLGSVTISRVM